MSLRVTTVLPARSRGSLPGAAAVVMASASIILVIAVPVVTRRLTKSNGRGFVAFRCSRLFVLFAVFAVFDTFAVDVVDVDFARGHSCCALFPSLTLLLLSVDVFLVFPLIGCCCCCHDPRSGCRVVLLLWLPFPSTLFF